MVSEGAPLVISSDEVPAFPLSPAVIVIPEVSESAVNVQLFKAALLTFAAEVLSELQVTNDVTSIAAPSL